MKWNRIVFKLSGTIILLILMVLFPLGYVIDQIFSGFYYSKTQEEINRLSSRYAQMIARSPDLITVNMIEMMAGFAEVKLYIADKDGKIVAHSDVQGLIGKEVPIKELKALSKGQSIQKMFQDPVSGRRFLISGKPIMVRNSFYGGVFVLSSIDEINQSIQKARELIILSGIGVFFIALGFIWFLTRKLSDPLLQMERVARQIAKGNLHARVKVTSGDEIGSLAKAINDLAYDLQRIHDTRREFFANISHELRTPITYIEGYAKVLKEGMYQTQEEKEQYLDIIQQESKRITFLIHDLFELSKMEEGKISLNLEWIDLVEVVESAVQKIELKAKGKGLEIHVCIQDGLPFIYGDGLRTEQILTNLLDNAIRYTEKGAISIQIISNNPHQVKVCIEDTGMGIPKEELPFIFERFYRVEKSRSRQYGGTGLGLAIVKNLVNLQGGMIKVFSKVGEGTKFEIVFSVPDQTK